MSELKFKCRSDSTFENKSSVYFFAHSDDYEEYFQTIADEILGSYDCKVWFDSEPNSQFDDDLKLELQQMRLFVIPVTTRLLTDKSRALECELSFAIEHHIPVLPLIQECGVDSLFSLKFGNMQYLNRYDDDLTSLSYEEKLKRFLSAVIIGEDDAKRIRDEFAAYVFLSYRKKDRRYARDLMRLIHGDDRFRDVAIWYDEFLTPGEDFNLEILNKMAKADVFALAVTPSLLEWDNYIMRFEYPAAVELDLPILPIELVDTQRDGLVDGYEGITDIKNASCPQDVFVQLMSFLGEKHINYKNTPEHLYLIGLAYLNGIDVDVDHSRAIELITLAAEQDHIDATEKLAGLYEMGFGVQRDINEAIRWQLKLIELLKQAAKTGDAKDVIRLLRSLRRLGAYRHDAFDYGKAASAYTDMMRIARLYSGRMGDELEKEDVDSYTELNRLLTLSYELMGNMCERHKKYRKAMRYYKKALQRAKKNAEGDDLGALYRLTWCYVRIGIVKKLKGWYYDAIQAFWKAFDVCERIEKLNDGLYMVPYIALNMGECYWKYGIENPSNADRWFEHAERCYLQAIAWAERTLEVDPRHHNSYDYICLCYNHLGLMQEHDGEKREYHLKALAYANMYLEKNESFWALEHKAATLTLIGGTFYEDKGAALGYYEETLEIRRKIYSIAPNETTAARLSEALVFVGHSNKMLGRADEARYFYNEALELLRSFDRGGIDVQEGIAYVLFMIAMIDDKNPDFDILMESYRIHRSLALKNWYGTNLDSCSMIRRIIKENRYK